MAITEQEHWKDISTRITHFVRRLIGVRFKAILAIYERLLKKGCEMKMTLESTKEFFNKRSYPLVETNSDSVVY